MNLRVARNRPFPRLRGKDGGGAQPLLAPSLTLPRKRRRGHYLALPQGEGFELFPRKVLKHWKYRIVRHLPPILGWSDPSGLAIGLAVEICHGIVKFETFAFARAAFEYGAKSFNVFGANADDLEVHAMAMTLFPTADSASHEIQFSNRSARLVYRGQSSPLCSQCDRLRKINPPGETRFGPGDIDRSRGRVSGRRHRC